MHQTSSRSTSSTTQAKVHDRDGFLALPFEIFLIVADFASLHCNVFKMASLREVIFQVKAIVNNPMQSNAPLEWPIPGLRSCLKHCSLSRLEKWHKRVHDEYDKQVAQDLTFYDFQEDVWDCLKRASEKSHQLRLWTKGKMPSNSRFNFISYRHLVLEALADVLEAFEHFSAMDGTPVGIVLMYIKKCYEFMIRFGNMLYPHGDGDNWYAQHAEFLVNTNLNGFILNGNVVMEVAADPTLAASILDPASMPASCLPLRPQPPILTCTKGPYGPRLSRNLYWAQ